MSVNLSFLSNGFLAGSLMRLSITRAFVSLLLFLQASFGIVHPSSLSFLPRFLFSSAAEEREGVSKREKEGGKEK